VSHCQLADNMAVSQTREFCRGQCDGCFVRRNSLTADDLGRETLPDKMMALQLLCMLYWKSPLVARHAG
jgi:hypothetical protein